MAYCAFPWDQSLTLNSEHKKVEYGSELVHLNLSVSFPTNRRQIIITEIGDMFFSKSSPTPFPYLQATHHPIYIFFITTVSYRIKTPVSHIVVTDFLNYSCNKL